MYCVLESVFRLCCVSSAVWIFFFLEAETRTIFYCVGPSPIICYICDKKFNKNGI